MRKLFSTLKSVVAVAIVASMTLAASCSYDDTAIKNKVDKVESDLAALTERVDALEQRFTEEMPTLEDLLDGKLVITEVTTDADGNTTLKLSDGSTVTVLAEGLQYRVTDGVLEVSADGETWVALGVEPEFVIADADVNADNTVTLTLADGTEVTLVKAEVIEFNATRGQLYVLPGETKDLRFTINDAVAEINVMNQPLGWKAEVALAPAEEETPEEGDDLIDNMPMPAPAAAGGTDYVLKITGPAQDFVNAGYAAKEGKILVHFNTANGACKVASIDVTLAELTLSVDREGNVHIENSVTTTSTDHMGEEFTEFAPIQIGVMTKACYEQHLAGTLDIMSAIYDGELSSTSWGFFNKVDPIEYVEGECEKAVFDLTVADVSAMFWPAYEFVSGGEYVIFLYTEEDMDMMEGMTYPVLESAIFATYKSTVVDVTIVENSVTWNDATLKMSLAGYTNYLVGWVSDAYLQECISYNMCTDLNSLLDIWLKSPMGQGINQDAGAILPNGMPADTELKLSKLAEYSLSMWAPAVEPGNTYYLYVYPFDMQSEMDLWTLQPTHEDVYLFGTFTTADITKGDFTVEPTYTATPGQYTLEVEVEFTEEYTVYYEFYPDTAVDVDERIAQVFEDCYSSQTGTTVYADTYNYGEYPQVLSMVVVNAAGEYIYVEKEFTEPKPEELTFTEVNVTKANTNLTLNFSDGTNTLAVTVWNQEGYALADGTYTLNTNISSYDGVTFNDQICNSYYCGAFEMVVTTTDNGQKFDIAFTWDGDKYVATFEGVAAADPNALPTWYLYMTLDMTNYNGNVDSCYVSTISAESDISLALRNDNWDWVILTFPTAGTTYIAPGTYTVGDTLGAKSYNGYTLGALTAGTVEVAYDAATGYTIKFDVTENSNNYKGKFVGDLSAKGITAPAEGGAEDGGAEDGVIVFTTMSENRASHQYYGDYLLSDDSGNNQLVIVVDQSDATTAAIVADTYTWKAYYNSIFIGGHFAFEEGTVKINGTTVESNAQITAGSLTVAEDGSLTGTITVDDTEYTFQYNK
ncbi:MAG: hypothetical protein IJX40_05390 [Alistipes sp.]|nr:hypothetical protein [Alistipes sp.]